MLITKAQDLPLNMSLLVASSSRNLVDTLLELKKRALRKGVWFQTLTFEDRILANLIQRHVKIVKNATLATVIARIMGKLLFAIKNRFFSKLVAIGRPIAAAVAMKAYSFGNRQALDWISDMNYVKYMGLAFSSSCVPPTRLVNTRSHMLLIQNERRKD